MSRQLRCLPLLEALLWRLPAVGYVHCVVVRDPAQFSGEWLKHSGAESDSVMKLAKRSGQGAGDQEQDGARWARFAGRVPERAGLRRSRRILITPSRRSG